MSDPFKKFVELFLSAIDEVRAWTNNVELKAKLTRLRDYVTSDEFGSTPFNIIGSVSTFLAMVPQGLLAALEMKKGVKKYNLPVAAEIALMSSTAVTTEEGKRQLLRLFNRNDFKNLNQFIANLFNPRKWNLLNIVNGYFTLHAAGVFVNLTQDSLIQASKFFYKFPDKSTNKIAIVFANHWFQLPFMVSSGLTNLLGYPSIFQGFVGLVNDHIHLCVETPQYRHLRDEKKSRIRSVRNQWIKDCKRYGIEQANQSLFEQLNKNADLDYSVENLLDLLKAENTAKRILKLSNNNDYVAWDNKITAESRATSITKRIYASVLTGGAILGMENFEGFGSETYDKLYLSKVNYLGEMAAYACMIIMVLAIVYPTQIKFWDYMSGQLPSARTLEQSLWQFISTGLLAIYICGFGSMANMYQAYMESESFPIILISGLGSFLLEIEAVLIVIAGYGWFNKRDDKNVESVVDINATIVEIENETTLSDKEVKQLSTDVVATETTQLLVNDELSNEPTTPPRYRNWATRCAFFKNDVPKPADSSASNDEEVGMAGRPFEEQQEVRLPLWRRALGC